MDSWIAIFSVLFSLVWKVSAELCRYDTPAGSEYVFCYEKCCEGYKTSRYEVCCAYNHPTTGMIVGGAVGLMVVFGTSVLCCFYMFCKRQLRRRDRLRNHSTVQGRNTIIPTVSSTVPVLSPPPYEEISPQPPPYTASNLAYVDEQSSLPLNNVYPDHPPPKYSKSDKFPTRTK